MNNKKILGLTVSAVLALGILSGCGGKTEPASKPSTTPTTAPASTTATTPATTKAATTKVDAVTTASIVNDQAAFLKAASKDGTWIICTLKDMTIDKEIVLEGEFKNKDVVARKIALYTQDDKKNVTARFSLKAPKLTVKSENAKIQGGTFVGDVYVQAKGFSVVDAKVEGNIYFASEEAKSTFKLDKATVTGVQEVKK